MGELHTKIAPREGKRKVAKQKEISWYFFLYLALAKIELLALALTGS